MKTSAVNTASAGLRTTVGELFLTFLKIGSTAFGGGFMALISVVQNYAVERRKWLSQEDMLDGISLATILPGPVAVNVVAFVGYRVRGWSGALASVLGVILPSFLLMVTLSYAYFNYGQMPFVGNLFKGLLPAITAIIVATAWNMGARTVRGGAEAAIALVAFLLLLGVGGFFITAVILTGGGIAGWLLFRPPASSASLPESPTIVREDSVDSCQNDSYTRRSIHTVKTLPAICAGTAPLLGLSMTAAVKLFITFAGMSLLLFGGGYVIIPIIQQSVVNAYGWVTRQEFIDGIALSQVMPGPILITAAFIGYKVAGVSGAAAATAGIFTPPAILMLICTGFFERIKKSETIKACMRGIRPTVIGMIALAAVVVGRTSEHNWASLVIFVAALAAQLRFKVEVVWIIPASGIAGLLLY
ncbi:MAG TPA: chromate efflux transporter [Nitrospirota bacterium]|nr:chromate efflux transporter [Nitrospirota bacterium]